MPKYQLNNVPIVFMPPLINRNEIFVPMNEYYYAGIKPYYLISSFGRVFNKFTGKFLTVYLRGKGNTRFAANFQFYTLDGRTIEKRIFVHRAMMIAFYYRGDCDFLEVDHVDGVWYHNYLSNLEWVTKEENYNRFLNIKNKQDNPIYRLSSAPRLLYFDEVFSPICNKIPNISDRYLISNYGRVYDQYTDTFWPGYMDDHNIMYIDLIDTNSKNVTFPLIELIAKTHYEHERNYSRLIDQQTTNLFIKDNIEWTNQEDESGKYIKIVNNQKIHCGEGSTFQTKLTEEKVHKICKLLEENKLSLTEIANMFHVTNDAIYRIKKGDNWKHISCKYKLPKVIPRGSAIGELNVVSKYSEVQIRQICELLEKHQYSNVEIANKLNVNTSLVSHIKNHVQWTHISKDYNI